MATSNSVLPTTMKREDLFRLTPVTGTFTVTEQDAVLPPSSVVAVMVAVPPETALTLPFESTVATFVLELDHDTRLLVALEGATVAVNVSLPPTSIVNDDLFKLTLDTETGSTVKTHDAVFPPSSVVAIITEVPTLIADTFPFESTIATLLSELDHDTFLLVAFEGIIVGVSFSVPPIVNVKNALFSDIPVTKTGFTVTVQVAVLDPSFVFIVIVVEPTAFAVTTPKEETVATEVLLEDQVTDGSVAFSGSTVDTRVSVSPTVIVRLVLFKLTELTGITLALTVTEHDAVLPPSAVVTVI